MKFTLNKKNVYKAAILTAGILLGSLALTENAQKNSAINNASRISSTIELDQELNGCVVYEMYVRQINNNSAEEWLKTGYYVGTLEDLINQNENVKKVSVGFIDNSFSPSDFVEFDENDKIISYEEPTLASIDKEPVRTMIYQREIVDDLGNCISTGETYKGLVPPTDTDNSRYVFVDYNFDYISSDLILKRAYKKTVNLDGTVEYEPTKIFTTIGNRKNSDYVWKDAGVYHKAEGLQEELNQVKQNIKNIK